MQSLKQLLKIKTIKEKFKEKDSVKQTQEGLGWGAALEIKILVLKLKMELQNKKLKMQWMTEIEKLERKGSTRMGIEKTGRCIFKEIMPTVFQNY